MNSRMTEKGYGFISKEVICDKNITVNAKAVYAYLCAYAGKRGICYPSRDLMADELNISKRRIYDCIKELSDNGYIDADTTRHKGRFATTVYAITHVCKDDNGETRRETFDEDESHRNEDINDSGCGVNEDEAYCYGDIVAGGYDVVSSLISADDDKNNLSDVDGFTGGNFTARGFSAGGNFTVRGFTAHGFSADGIYKYNNNKYNTKKNNTFKNNTVKNNSKQVMFNKTHSKINYDLTDFISEYPNGDLKNALIAFIEMRKDIGKPVSQSAFKIIIKQLNSLSQDEFEQVKIIEQSVANSWVSIYPLKKNSKKSGGGNVFLRYLQNSQ